MPKVLRTKIIGTQMVVYSAWEPVAAHSTLTTIDGERGGRIGSRRLPERLEALPAMSTERSAAVDAWHKAQYQEAYAEILANYPCTVDGRVSMGEITTFEVEG